MIAYVEDDLLSVRLTLDAILELYDILEEQIEFDLVIDWRLIGSDELSSIEDKTKKLVTKFRKLKFIDKIIVTSSSIPAFIGALVDTNSTAYFERLEYALQYLVTTEFKGDVVYGDYTVVTPDYSDANLPLEYMRSRQTPRAIYSGKEKSFVARGGGLKRYGDNQFFDLAKSVVRCGLFRPKNSHGDIYIEDVSSHSLTKKVAGVLVAKCGNASKWIEVTVNSHISFIVKMMK